jgi:D-inositol-3-phosphate glycosyltransferase
VKILIAAHHFPPHLSGVGRVAEQQAKHLALNGDDVTVLTSDCDDKAGVTKQDGYIVYKLRVLNFMESRMSAPFPIFSPALFWCAYRLVKDADVVHVHDAFYMTSIAVAIMAKIERKPLFMTQHIEVIPHPNKLIMAVQHLVYATSGIFIFHSCQKVVTYNRRVSEFLLAKGISKKKIIEITNGVNFELFYPVKMTNKRALRLRYGLPEERMLALFVGRFVPKKGFDKLVQSTNKNYTLVFVGGEKPSNLMNNMNKIFLGTFSQEETADIYRACDVFVLPSEGEGFPLSIQEAMACGLPIITTDDVGYTSYEFNRSLFYLIKPTIKEIKKHLIAISRDTNLQKRMKSYSLTYARANFNWEKTISILSEIYQESL